MQGIMKILEVNEFVAQTCCLGRGIWISRSSLPALLRAGSRAPGLLVAAIIASLPMRSAKSQLLLSEAASIRLAQ